MPRALFMFIAVSLYAAATSAQSWVFGVEGDDSRGYVYLSRLQPIRLPPNREFTLWGTASYLFYDVHTRQGESRVTSPGLGAGVMYRRYYPRWSFSGGPGYEVRWTEREEPTGGRSKTTNAGYALQGQIEYKVTDSMTAAADAAYSDPIDWVWTRASVRQSLGSSLRIGPELSFQGNDDVRVRQFGGLAELPLGGDSALQFRAGQSTIRYRDGFEASRPYYSVGFARSF